MALATNSEGAHVGIAETITAHPVGLFMKGTLARPQGGFSAAVVAVLSQYDVPAHAIDILADPAIRRVIETYSDWPTIPRLHLRLWSTPVPYEESHHAFSRRQFSEPYKTVARRDRRGCKRPRRTPRALTRRLAPAPISAGT